MRLGFITSSMQRRKEVRWHGEDMVIWEVDESLDDSNLTSPHLNYQRSLHKCASNGMGLAQKQKRDDSKDKRRDEDESECDDSDSDFSSDSESDDSVSDKEEKPFKKGTNDGDDSARGEEFVDQPFEQSPRRPQPGVSPPSVGDGANFPPAQDIVQPIFDAPADFVNPPINESPQERGSNPSQPTLAQPIQNRPVFEQPRKLPVILDDPTVNLPVLEPNDVEQPVVEPPAIEPPVVEQPVVEQPVVEPPVVEQPVIEPPVVEQPVVEPPVVEQPVVEPPVVEQPTQPVPVEPAPQQPPEGGGEDSERAAPAKPPVRPPLLKLPLLDRPEEDQPPPLGESLVDPPGPGQPRQDGPPLEQETRPKEGPDQDRSLDEDELPEEWLGQDRSLDKDEPPENGPPRSEKEFLPEEDPPPEDKQEDPSPEEGLPPPREEEAFDHKPLPQTAPEFQEFAPGEPTQTADRQEAIPKPEATPAPPLPPALEAPLAAPTQPPLEVEVNPPPPVAFPQTTPFPEVPLADKEGEDAPPFATIKPAPDETVTVPIIIATTVADLPPPGERGNITGNTDTSAERVLIIAGSMASAILAFVLGLLVYRVLKKRRNPDGSFDFRLPFFRRRDSWENLDFGSYRDLPAPPTTSAPGDGGDGAFPPSGSYYNEESAAVAMSEKAMLAAAPLPMMERMPSPLPSYQRDDRFTSAAAAGAGQGVGRTMNNQRLNSISIEKTGFFLAPPMETPRLATPKPALQARGPSEYVNRISGVSTQSSSISSGFGDGDIIVTLEPIVSSSPSQGSEATVRRVMRDAGGSGSGSGQGGTGGGGGRVVGGGDGPKGHHSRMLSSRFSWMSRGSKRDTSYTQASEDSPPRFRSVTSWVNQQSSRIKRAQDQQPGAAPPVPTMPGHVGIPGFHNPPAEQTYNLMIDDEQPRRVEFNQDGSLKSPVR